MNKLEKVISIGSCCDSLFLSKILNIRERGPVDNMGAHNFKDIFKLFNGEFLKSILQHTYCYSDYNPFGDAPMCHFDGFFMMHNDYRLKKTKVHLLERCHNFELYCNNAKQNKNLFFLYSIIWTDEKLSFKEQINTFNKLPNYVKNKMIIINGRYKDTKKIFNFLNYPIFYYDTNKLKSNNFNDDVNKKFKIFWDANKTFYEKRNNCKYDDFEIKNEES